MIKILLADRQPAVLKGLEMNLSLESDCQIVGSTSSSDELLALYHALQPDVVVADVVLLTELDGQLFVQVMGQGNGRIIAHSIYDNRTLRAKALALGIQSFVVKQGGSQQLLAIIRRIARQRTEDRNSANEGQ